MNETIFYDLTQTNGLAHSLADQISRELGRKIVSSYYKPGDLIEDEKTLSEYYRVSRTVVRDAVKILVGKRLLEVRRGIGTRVCEREDWSLLDTNIMAWHLSADPCPDFLYQFLDFRQVIEPKAAKWAAEKGNDEDFKRIEECIKKMEQKADSIEAFIIADALFHKSILTAANNIILKQMERVVYSALIGSIRLTNSDPRKNSNSIIFHRNVADAIFERDGETAELLMSQLLLDTKKGIKKILK